MFHNANMTLVTIPTTKQSFTCKIFLFLFRPRLQFDTKIICLSLICKIWSLTVGLPPPLLSFQGQWIFWNEINMLAEMYGVCMFLSVIFFNFSLIL